MLPPEPSSFEDDESNNSGVASSMGEQLSQSSPSPSSSSSTSTPLSTRKAAKFGASLSVATTSTKTTIDASPQPEGGEPGREVRFHSQPASPSAPVDGDSAAPPLPQQKPRASSSAAAFNTTALPPLPIAPDEASLTTDSATSHQPEDLLSTSIRLLTTSSKREGANFVAVVAIRLKGTPTLVRRTSGADMQTPPRMTRTASIELPLPPLSELSQLIDAASPPSVTRKPSLPSPSSMRR
jgi:hypothetical protein